VINTDVKLASSGLITTVTDNTTTCNNNIKATTNTIERKKETKVHRPDYKEKDTITNQSTYTKTIATK